MKHTVIATAVTLSIFATMSARANDATTDAAALYDATSNAEYKTAATGPKAYSMLHPVLNALLDARDAYFQKAAEDASYDKFDACRVAAGDFYAAGKELIASNGSPSDMQLVGDLLRTYYKHLAKCEKALGKRAPKPRPLEYALDDD
jgi:hypothetical protein